MATTAGEAQPPTPSVSWMKYDPERYDELLTGKVDALKQQFAPWLSDGLPFEVYASAASHFRSRARFAVTRLPPEEGPLRYVLFEGKSVVPVDGFPIATRAINDLMPRLLAELNGVEVLGANIAAVHFLCTQSGDMLVSLIYASPLPQPEWRAAAERLRSTLGVPALLGRAKGTCEVLGRDWVTERLRLADGRTLTYRQMEGSFSNPSAQMCEHTLNFLCAAAADCNASLARRRRADGSVGSTVDGASPLPKPNLLELYSGNGNHTVALAPLFGRVLTVEIDRRLCDAAAVNLEQNGISNACVLCAPSAKFCDRLLRRLRRPAEASLRAPTTATAAVQPSAPSAAAAATTAPCVANAPTPPESAEAAWLREARRCEVILVDPPRCGLDDTTRALVEQYEHVLYVSCNPVDALREDLKRLGEAYEVRRFAVFDHFAYTPHIECAVQLSRRSR